MNDVLFLAIVAVLALLGYWLGLMRALTLFAPYLLAVVLTPMFAPYLVKALTAATPIDQQISGWIGAKVGIAEWEGQFADWMADPQIQSAMAEHNLGSISAIGNLGSLTANLADTAAHYLLLIGASIVLFIAIKIATSLLFKGLIAGVRRVRVLRWVDQLGGLAIGLLVGLAGATLVVAVWTPISGAISKGETPKAEASQALINQHWLPLLGVDQNLYFRAAEDWLMPLLTQQMPSDE